MRSLVVVVLLSGCASAPAPAPAAGSPGPVLPAAPEAEPDPEPDPEPEPESDPDPEDETETAPEQAMVASGGYSPTSEDVVLLQQVFQAVEEIARVMESNENCDRMVDGLERVVVRVRPLISRAKEIEKQKERSAWFKQQAEAQLTVTVERMVAPLQRCAQNKRLLTLMQSLGS